MTGDEPAATGHPMAAPSVTSDGPGPDPSRQRDWKRAGDRCTYSPAESLNEGPQAGWGNPGKGYLGNQGLLAPAAPGRDTVPCNC